MALTINDFKAIANGSYNVGQIKLNGEGTGLVKVNNHVWKTSQNNVQLTAEENRAVREQLVRAFEDHVSPDRLMQIRSILLDGGRATRSLGRDFVKHLIATATDRQKLAENIVSSMTIAEKQLLNRNVTVQGVRSEVPQGLMTSTCEQAYETYASEAMDLAAAKAHGGVAMFDDVRLLSEVQRASTLSTALAHATNGIADLLRADSRTRDAAPALFTELRNLGTGFYSTYLPLFTGRAVDAEQLFAAAFEREVRALYDKYNIPGNVANDHFARIFPKPPHFTNVADELRRDFTKVGTPKIYGFSPYEVQGNLLAIHQRIMRELANMINHLPNFSVDFKTVANNTLDGIRGSGIHDMTPRMSELMHLDKLVANNTDTTLVVQFEAFITQDIKSVFHNLPGGDDIAKSFIASLHRLGMGI